MTWQYITAGHPSGKLDNANWANFDKLVQACLATGAYCMLDLHNFARYDGIVGQGGPTDQVFAGLWTQIATYYAKEDKIIFGLMNEPHDLDMQLWAKSCQAAVTAIREAGATSQTILLPATNFASAETYVSSGSAEALAAITNPDGSTDNLVMDVHKYLDINNSGTYTECTTNNLAAFKTLSDWLRKVKRVAIISETGASMQPSCMTKFCEQNEFIAKNDEVLVGFIAWGAGAFDSSYILTILPSESGDTWTDNKLMKQCILAPFGKDRNISTSTMTSASSSITQASATTAVTLTGSPTGSPTGSASGSPTGSASGSPTGSASGSKDAGSGNDSKSTKYNSANHLAMSRFCIFITSMTIALHVI
ncbi:hypothetical protein E4U41_007643 [Claviceps citrina]|nr:hypothetical protein E4U41_007643 [Claviceps citrina]